MSLSNCWGLGYIQIAGRIFENKMCGLIINGSMHIMSIYGGWFGNFEYNQEFLFLRCPFCISYSMTSHGVYVLERTTLVL